MRCSILRVSLLALLVTSLAAQTTGWSVYKNADGNFSVLLPGVPTDTVNSKEDMASHTIQALVNKVSYTVVYVKLPAPQEVTEGKYRQYRDSVIKALPSCAVADESPAAPALPDHIGRHYRINCTISNAQFSFVGNLYWGRNYSYAVLGMFQTAPADPPEIRKFVDSFAVGPAK